MQGGSSASYYVKSGAMVDLSLRGKVLLGGIVGRCCWEVGGEAAGIGVRVWLLFGGVRCVCVLIGEPQSVAAAVIVAMRYHGTRTRWSTVIISCATVGVRWVEDDYLNTALYGAATPSADVLSGATAPLPEFMSLYQLLNSLAMESSM